MEVEGQLLGGLEVHHVDEGVRGSQLGHVGAVQHHGDHVVGKEIEELLRDVVLGQAGGDSEGPDFEPTYPADAVLQGEIELVAPVDHLVTFLLSLSSALQFPTTSVDIDLDVFSQRLDQAFSVTLGVTVRHKLGYRSSASLEKISSNIVTEPTSDFLTFLGRFVGQMSVVGSELLNNIREIPTRSPQSLHPPVCVLHSSIASVGNGNVEERFKSWERI